MPQSASNQPLTPAEHHLVDCFSIDDPSDYLAYDADIEAQVVRGAFLRALICGEVPSAVSSPVKDCSILRVRNALIVGVVDLSGSNPATPYLLQRAKISTVNGYAAVTVFSGGRRFRAGIGFPPCKRAIASQASRLASSN
jgi:hypothetical protein